MCHSHHNHLPRIPEWHPCVRSFAGSLAKLHSPSSPYQTRNARRPRLKLFHRAVRACHHSKSLRTTARHAELCCKGESQCAALPTKADEVCRRMEHALHCSAGEHLRDPLQAKLRARVQAPHLPRSKSTPLPRQQAPCTTTAPHSATQTPHPMSTPTRMTLISSIQPSRISKSAIPTSLHLPMTKFISNGRS